MLQAEVTKKQIATESESNVATKIIAAERPRTEMHALPIETVTGIVKTMGGQIIDIESTQARSGSLISTTSYVTR